MSKTGVLLLQYMCWTLACYYYSSYWWLCIQPIPLEVTFSNAVSKLKVQSSNVSFHWKVAKETWEIWALNFRKFHPSGIGCTTNQLDIMMGSFITTRVYVLNTGVLLLEYMCWTLACYYYSSYLWLCVFKNDHSWMIPSWCQVACNFWHVWRVTRTCNSVIHVTSTVVT